MKTKHEHVLVVALAISLCVIAGCQSERPRQTSPVFSELPAQQPKLSPNEVLPADWRLAAEEVLPIDWTPAIQALFPVYVYREGGNLVVVQILTNGVESGKYVIGAASSTGPIGRFNKFAHVDSDGFSPLTRVYDFERRQP